MDWLIPCDQPVDVAVVAAHPDDAEVHAGGMLLQMAQAGHRVGIIDCSQGEMGTRGTPAQRREEALAASALLPNSCRVNLGLPDSQLMDTLEGRQRVVAAIRAMKPRLVLIHHPEDMHPDHRGASVLGRHGTYLASLKKVAPEAGERHIVERVLSFPGRATVTPSVLIDISAWWDRKLELLASYGSQFVSAATAGGTESRLSRPEFMQEFEAQHRAWGSLAGTTYAEPLVAVHQAVRLDSLSALWQAPSRP